MSSSDLYVPPRQVVAWRHPPRLLFLASSLRRELPCLLPSFAERNKATKKEKKTRNEKEQKGRESEKLCFLSRSPWLAALTPKVVFFSPRCGLFTVGGIFPGINRAGERERGERVEIGRRRERREKVFPQTPGEGRKRRKEEGASVCDECCGRECGEKKVNGRWREKKGEKVP